MRKLGFQLILLLSLAAGSFAQDTVLLKNGDILTGKILQQNADYIYFKSPSFGSVALQTKDIAELRFETADGGAGSIPPEALPPESDEPTAVKKGTWNGQAGMAIAMRDSSSSDKSGVVSQEKYETYRVYGNVDWQGKKNKLRWDWNYRYSQNEISKRDDYFNVSQKYYHDFKDSYYATSKTIYQRDFKRKIEHEYLQTAEVGMKWIDGAKLTFSTSAGGGYHKYDRVSNAEGEVSIGQPKFILDESIRWQLLNSLTVMQKYTHLGDLTDYHFVFTAGLENKLINDVFLRLEYRLDRDTEVYYDDRGYEDKALMTSLLYKF